MSILRKSISAFFIASYLYCCCCCFYILLPIFHWIICVANKILPFFYFSATSFVTMNLLLFNSRAYRVRQGIIYWHRHTCTEIRYIFIRLFMCHFCFYFYFNTKILKHTVNCQIYFAIRNNAQQLKSTSKSAEFIYLWVPLLFYLCACVWLMEMSSIILQAIRRMECNSERSQCS